MIGHQINSTYHPKTFGTGFMEDQSETGLTDRPENGDHFEDNEDVEDDDSGEGELLIKSHQV